ncbi:MFS transporter [Novosphingobium marinum]|uniref:MFS family permease n=1 Tax=Novosphingobium marinum TaxID=1514948 RepID=A0A7Y9Y124_9SPHN|nr:MFS transporter [Novosphingobium marinum]NYH96778.1 MFS family permease [Novosphingobium marinum]GGC40307.1 MFS transporter [Novosphingobium marinum]
MNFLGPVFTILIAIFTLQAGVGSLQALVGLRLDAQGMPAPVIGLAGTSYFLGLTIGSLRVFGIIGRVGHIRAFAAFVSLYSASALAYALFDNAWFWIALRLVDGFAIAGVFVCLESWLNDRADPAKRGTTLAFYMMALYAGQALSQALLALGTDIAWQPFVVASLLLSLAIGPVALTHMAEPKIDTQQVFSLRRLYAASPLGAVGTVVTGVMLGAFYAMAAVHAQRIGMRAAEIAALMAGVIAGGMALQWPFGRLSDRFDRRTVVVLLFGAVAIVSGVLAIEDDTGRFVLLAVLFGGGAFALYPLCVAHTNDHLEPGERTAASGGLILLYSVGAVAGPVLGSVAMRVLGPGGLYALIGAFSALAFLFGIWRQVTAAAVPNAEQGDFQVLPRTTPMAAALDSEQG